MYMPQIQLGRFVLGALLAAIAGITSVAMVSDSIKPSNGLSISPNEGLFEVGEQFSVNVQVASNVPTNVFGGDISFAPDILKVEKIDYNTSIADLWAVEPWFSNGEGTINFAGGTTKRDGFSGEGTLLTITFTTVAPGEGVLKLTNARLLQHDGFGTDIPLPDNPIDAVFAVSDEIIEAETVAVVNDNWGVIRTVTKKPSTDLNQDGKTSMADFSVFMLHFANKDTASDFNADGKVNTADLSIILQAM